MNINFELGRALANSMVKRSNNPPYMSISRPKVNSNRSGFPQPGFLNPKKYPVMDGVNRFPLPPALGGTMTAKNPITVGSSPNRLPYLDQWQNTVKGNSVSPQSIYGGGVTPMSDEVKRRFMPKPGRLTNRLNPSTAESAALIANVMNPYRDTSPVYYNNSSVKPGNIAAYQFAPELRADYLRRTNPGRPIPNPVRRTPENVNLGLSTLLSKDWRLGPNYNPR